MAALSKHVLLALVSFLTLIIMFGAFTPPAASANSRTFHDTDLMSSEEHQLWTISHIIRTIVTDLDETQITELDVNSETKKSLLRIHKTFVENVRLDMQFLSYMSYAYSYSNAPFYSYFGSWAPYFCKQGKALGTKLEEYKFYRENKVAFGTTVVVGVPATGGSLYALSRYLTPLMTRISPAIVTRVVSGLWGATKTAIGVVLTPVGATTVGSIAYFGKILSDYWVAGPYALDYYTKKLTGDNTEALEFSTTGSTYGYTRMMPHEYYEHYLNSYLYHALQKSLLADRRQKHPVRFWEIGKVNKEQLWEIHGKESLTTKKSVAIKVCPSLITEDDENPIATEQACIAENKEALKDIIIIKACAKYVFLNTMEKFNSLPLMLVSICDGQNGDEDAYIKFPLVRFASVHKSALPDMIHRISRFTGASKVVVQQ